jgi:hypothetical protein
MGTTAAFGALWRARLLPWWAGVWRWLLMAAGLALGTYFLLDRGIGNGVASAAAIGGLVIGATLTRTHRMAIPLMAMPALFIVERAGFGGGDLTVSDVALTAAFGVAILLGDRAYSAPVRRILILNIIYQFATLLTVIVNPYVQNTVEWLHAWMLVSGALIVGWVLGAAGLARHALILMMASGAILAIGTIVTAALQYAHGDFSAVYPAWPLPVHKNFAGCVLAFVFLIAFTNPPWAAISRWTARWLMVLLAAAIIMTQSRQAWIGLLVSLLVLVVRRGARGHMMFIAVLAVPGLWLIAQTVFDQIGSQNRFNSYFVRIDWIRATYALWKMYPFFGRGLRYWYVDPTFTWQPPQGEFEVLASAGAVGLLAFIVMWVGIVVILWRVDALYGGLALAVVVSRLTQAQFDLFWVSAQVSIPFVIAGICLGAQAYAARQTAAAVEGVRDAASARDRSSPPVALS